MVDQTVKRKLKGIVFTKPTLTLIKQIFGLIDEHVYGMYIKDTMKKQNRKITFFITDEIEGDSTTRIQKGDHAISINPLAFENKENPLHLLQQLLESESVVVTLDFYHDVKRNRDRPYDLFGVRRKCVSNELFGEYLHNDRIPSKEIVWFEKDDGAIIEGKVIENIKNERKTIVKAKDGGEDYTISDDKIYGTTRDDFFVK